MRFKTLRIATGAAVIAIAATAAQAQNNHFAFSLTGGVGSMPAYFGANSNKIGPTGAFGFTGLELGAARFGDADGPARFAPGTGLRGSFRYIPKRDDSTNLPGLDTVKTSVELGLGVHHTEEFWQIFADLRYGVIGHRAIAGELGANVILRPADGLIVHAGPRAAFGNNRFARTYFGVTPDEQSADFPAYTPSGGFHSVGLELGAYQSLSPDWGISASLRYDRLRGDAARSPIVTQGSRDQFGASLGLTRNFNLRF